jgi:glycosyltransferase involved in cell wall biosynthesis
MENNKKLILFMPSIDGGGVEKNLIIIANYLAKKIDNIFLITYENSFNNYFDKKIKIYNVTKKKTKSVNKYKKYFTCLYLLLKISFEYKKIVVFSFQANIYCSILAFFLKFNLITRSNSSPTGWAHGLIKKKIFTFFLRFADYIIVNSYAFKKELYKKFNLNSVVIYNPLNSKEIKNKSQIETNLEFLNDKKALKIINVARFTKQKDHITLLKSFKILSKKIKSKLLIIGYGPEIINIINFIKENKLSNLVKVLNFQKNPYKYIVKSDIFVLSSKYEGLPNVLLEAQCLKKFIISSNCPTGPKEILKNGKYGFLFKVGDYDGLAKKIILYSNNKKKYKKLIDLAYKDLDRFDFNLNCEKYFRLVNNLLIS